MTPTVGVKKGVVWTGLVGGMMALRMKCLAPLFLGLVTLASAQIRFVDGTTLAFGDPITQVAKRVNETAFASDPDRANGLQTIAIYPARFDFDAGRLWRAQIVVVASSAPPPSGRR